jgi:hypothetical protein
MFAGIAETDVAAIYLTILEPHCKPPALHNLNCPAQTAANAGAKGEYG